LVALIHLGRKVFGQHDGADDLGVKRQLQILAFQLRQLSWASGRGGRHHVIDGAHPVGEGGNRVRAEAVDTT
jgi:hypothetical protein